MSHHLLYIYIGTPRLIASLLQSLLIRQFLLANLSRPPGSEHLQFRIPIDTLEASLPLIGDFPFKETDKAVYEGPSLFVRGTRSHYVPEGALPLIRRFFLRFEVADIDAGHWLISEQPELFLRGKQVAVGFTCALAILTRLVVVDFVNRHMPSDV